MNFLNADFKRITWVYVDLTHTVGVNPRHSHAVVRELTTWYYCFKSCPMSRR
jgi:hypothetical protein